MLSVEGGNERLSYYVSGGLTNQDGFVINDQYKRYTSRVKINNDINEWFKFGVNIFGSFSDFSGIGPTSFYGTSPFVSPYEEDGNLVLYPKGAGTAQLNPFLNTEIDHKQLGNQISGLVFGEFDLGVEGLKYRINVNKNLNWSENNSGNPYGSSLTGSLSKVNSSRENETIDNIVSYELNQENHRVLGTLLYGYRKNRYNSTTAQGSNISNINLSYNSLQQALITDIASSAWSEASLYQMARLNYTYKDSYLFTGTIRRDGFSGFSKNHKFAIFPSFGIGWIISNESFFNLEKIEYLKLRSSYGQNGNQTSRYSSLARVAATDDFKYVFSDGGSSSRGQAIISLANEELRWEKTSGMNNEVDFSSFKNYISRNIDFYKTTTIDLLWDMVIPEVTGFSSIKTNLGKIKNTGIEISIGSQIGGLGEDLSWNFNFNFSSNQNRIVSLLGEDKNNDGKEDDLISSGLFIGKSIGAIYGYELDGIWQVDDEIPAGYNPGNYRIVDQNGDGRIDANNDRIFLGKSEPSFMAGFQSNLNYKNFALKFFINTIQGGKNGYLGPQISENFNSTGNFANSNIFTFYNDHWSVTNPDAKYSITYKAPQINHPKYM